MLNLGTHNGRTIFYVHANADTGFLNNVEGKNWMSLILCSAFSAKKHAKKVGHIIEHNPLFVYCVGGNHPDLEECVIEQLCKANEGFDDDTELPITFGDNDLKGAMKFCIESAFHESKSIDEIVLVDLNEEVMSEAEIEQLF